MELILIKMQIYRKLLYCDLSKYFSGIEFISLFCSYKYYQNMTQPTRLFDIPYFQLQVLPIEDAFVTKENGKWIKTSTQHYINQANEVSRALLRLGITEGEKIAVISTNNQTKWNILDIGILQIGAVNVPIYPTISPEEYQFILSHSEEIGRAHV